MELIPVPSALLARRLRSRLWCQKQAGIPHRGRSAKNMRFLATFILFLISASLSIATDDFLGARESRFKESVYDFCLSLSALKKAPVWVCDAGFPPLSPAKAYDIALKQAKLLRPEVTTWGTRDIVLEHVHANSGSFQEQDWIYLITLQDFSGPIAGVPWSLAIPIYMDGSTVNPVIIRSKK